MELVGEVVGGVVKRAIVLRGADVLAASVREALPQIGRASTSAPTFSVGATAMIAVTCFACGGVAGWALREMFKG